MMRDADRPRSPSDLALLALGVAGVLVALIWIAEFSGRPLSINDLFWQVRTGDLILDTGAVPGSDPFSYTVPGAGWNNHEWGFELAAALVHRVAGWGGIRVALALVMLATAGGLALAAGRVAGTPGAFLALALLWVLGWYKMSPVPQGLSMGIFLVACFVFRGERLARSPGRWAALVVLMLVWGNLTAECLMFLPFLVADQVALRFDREAAARPGFPTLRRHLLLLCLACVAPLVNPPQSSVLDYALAGTLANVGFNVEFAPLWAPANTIDGFGKGVARALVPAVALLAVVLLVRARGGRARAARTALPALMAAALATAFERNLWLLVVPVVLLGRAMAPASAPANRRRAAAVVALLLGTALIGRSAAIYGWNPVDSLRRMASPGYRHGHLDPAFVPVGCVDAIEGFPSVKRVYALRMWASYVIWRLPGVRVFIDGRNREYPVAVHRMADEIWEAGPQALAYLDATGTDAVVADPAWGDAPNIRGGPWRAALVGEGCAVYLRAPRR